MGNDPVKEKPTLIFNQVGDIRARVGSRRAIARLDRFLPSQFF